ncbi:RTA1 domain protein [Sporothrix schenckii 1099-18]|uniref:RTA1 domain protein n=1 Tax=Sporothrix schenckii 1099-18 TaxID=1397361 RepID=A0A0F2LRB7_SPOSC|nr:RTA1 domain protein [Sporothrix schenckii 1099-18]KJR80047.1 RTA1 domain protein [Sporothrix schenckii 1099-18]
MEDGKYVDGSIFIYAPNKGAPVFFAVGFLASLVFHIWQCIHYKSWRLTGLYVFSNTLFTAGYIVREVGAFNYGNVDVYIASTVLIYAAPPLFELANYVVLGRILYYVPHLSPIHPGRVLSTFAAISSVVEALNANGAAYSANSTLPKSKQDMGHALLKASLILQLVVVGLFLLLAIVYHRRTLKNNIHNKNLTNALTTLYISTSLLLIRTIYRVVEYFSIDTLHFTDGVDPSTFSPILRYEWFFYVFEASLMFTNTWLINFRHPRRYLPKSTKTYLSRDGVTEITGPGYKEERNFLMTIIDPFDVIGLLQGRDKKTAFWEQQEQQLQQQQQQQQRQQPHSSHGDKIPLAANGRHGPKPSNEEDLEAGL